MSASRARVSRAMRLRLALGGAAICWFAVSGSVNAADDELPDADFLEYLGSWEDSDEDWLLFTENAEEAAAEEEAQHTDSAAASESSTELKDES